MRPLVALLLVAAPLAGCAGPASEPVDVLATFYPLAFLAERIGGGNVSVATLVPVGVEPHEYEPTTTDFLRVGQARLLVVQGGGFEAWVEQARAQANGTRVVVATEGLELGSRAGEEDPHTWLDPTLYARMSENVERAMREAFPERAEGFATNAQRLREELATLDADYRAGLATCEVRLILTSHAAYAHLAGAYGFEQMAISGLSPEAEPDPQTVQRLVEVAREENITIVFFEELVSPHVAQIIADEVGGQTRILSPIEGVSDEERARGTDYFTLMRHNLAELRTAMRCT